jgi:hypothetical protein
MKLELFHATNEESSAPVRKLIVERGILDRFRFRNVFYDEVQADFTARGGTKLPALWDGTKLIEGEEAVLAAIRAL